MYFCLDSPMLLDMSRSPTHDDIKKKNLDEVLAVPEYTEAIYTHLRETEVSKRTFNMCIQYCSWR